MAEQKVGHVLDLDLIESELKWALNDTPAEVVKVHDPQTREITINRQRTMVHEHIIEVMVSVDDVEFLFHDFDLHFDYKVLGIKVVGSFEYDIHARNLKIKLAVTPRKKVKSSNQKKS